MKTLQIHCPMQQRQAVTSTGFTSQYCARWTPAWHSTSAPLLQMCIHLLNIKYSGEHKTFWWITTLCSPVQNTSRDFSSSDCQFKHGRGRESKSWTVVETSVVSWAWCSSPSTDRRSGAITMAGIAPSTFLCNFDCSDYAQTHGELNTAIS